MSAILKEGVGQFLKHWDERICHLCDTKVWDEKSSLRM
jgi:hypothetical protein